MIKRIYTIIFCAFCIINIHSQSKTDIEDTFKMQLFLNRKNVLFRTMDYSIVKNDSLYNVFKEITVLKIDTLKLDNKIPDNFEDEYKFYKLSIDNIKNSRKLVNDEHQYLGLGSGICSSFIIALNLKTGINYRLAGFDTNDFLGFLSDFKEMYFKTNYKKIKTSKILKYFKVEDLDFKCLYEGLKKDNLDREKYPCLQRCSEPIKLH